MNADRPLLGIFLMLCFCAVIPLGDALAKLLGGIVPLMQLMIARFGIQALLLLPFVLISGSALTMPGWVFKLTVLRAMLHLFGVGCMFVSLQYLPLADAVAIAFVMPFISLLLGKFFLDEEVGFRRLAACAVGFLGTLLIIQPSFEAVGAKEAASRDFQKAIKLNPKNQEILTSLKAEQIIAVASAGGEVAYYKKLSQEDPEDNYALLKLAIAFLEAQDKDAGARYLRSSWKAFVAADDFRMTDWIERLQKKYDVQF